MGQQWDNNGTTALSSTSEMTWKRLGNSLVLTWKVAGTPLEDCWYFFGRLLVLLWKAVISPFL